MSAMNLSLDVTEFENLMSLDMPVNSSQVTRWERKARQQQQAQQQNLSQSFSSSQSAASQGDRYIPHRAAMEFDMNNRSLATDAAEKDEDSKHSEHAKLLMANTLDGNNGDGVKPAHRVLAFKTKAPTTEHTSSLRILHAGSDVKREVKVAKPVRHIPSAPVRILDAPDMVDDYYLNLLSWGSNNVLSVALSQAVYLWNAASGDIQELMNVESTPGNYISSVAWIQDASHIAIGTADNAVQLWDASAGRQVRALRGHSARVGALAWNQHILASGSKDNTVLIHDVRIQNHVVGRMSQHEQEVCGLAWSPDGTYLASGANDNTLCIMDGTNMHSMDIAPKHILREHTAAVKALAWSPHERNLLATGGGTTDRCIKFWNAGTGSLINSIDTGSQVCALQWSPFEKELLSSHGYAENQLCLWKYPTLAKVKELKGHTSRVLHMATSPDGSLVCSGAADETLRFWSIFGSEGKKKGLDSLGPSVGGVKGLKSGTGLRIR